MNYKSVFATSYLALMLSLVACSNDASDKETAPIAYKTIESEKHGFSIVFPGEPTYSKKSFKLPIGGNKMKQETYILERDEAKYMLAVSSVPGVNTEDQTIQDAIRVAKRHLKKRHGGDATEEYTIYKDGLDGFELIWQTKAGKHVQYRNYRKKSRNYITYIFADNKDDAEPYATNFLDSLSFE